MRTPSLPRYYGLFCPSLGVILLVSILNAIAIGYQIEWLRSLGGFRGGGALCGGLCILIEGLDFVLLCGRYPSFLRENAPEWDTRSRKWSSVTMFLMGIWLIVGGSLLVYAGGWYLLDAIRSMY